MHAAGRRAVTTAFYWAVVWIGFALALLLLWQLRQVVMLAFLALLLAAALHDPLTLVERLPIPRVVALLGVYLALAGVIALILLIVLPPLVQQLAQLFQNLPQLLSGGERWLRDTVVPALPGDLGNRALEALRSRIGSLLPPIEALVGVPLLVAEFVANFSMVVFLSALLLLERDALRRALLAYVAEERRARVEEVAAAATRKLGAYVRGQLAIMVAIGVAPASG